MRKGLIGCLIGGVATIFLGFLALVLIGAFAQELQVGPQIAHVDIEGIITSQGAVSFFGEVESMAERVVNDVKDASENKDIAAIVLRINSPGGEVTAADKIFHAVEEARDAKPVVVYMDSLAASGGYYIACGANEIIANETTLTGSIGVIIQTLNYYELFDKIGLEALVFKSGELKDSLSGARRMTPREHAYVQGMVDQMYEKFLGIVAAGRGLDKDSLRNGIADGRVMSGLDALDESLVDATGYIEDAYDRARALSGSPDAKVFRYRRDGGMMGLLGAVARGGLRAADGQTGRVEIDISDRILPRLQPGMIYLLPSYYLP